MGNKTYIFVAEANKKIKDLEISLSLCIYPNKVS